MSANIVRFADITLALPDGWLDITHELSEGVPPTLARSDGIGALQLSVARYRAGENPHIRTEDLRQLLHDFADHQGLGKPKAVRERTEEATFVSGDFVTEGEMIRVWYVSNGRDVVLATYTTQELHDGRLEAEIAECDRIVLSMGFS